MKRFRGSFCALLLALAGASLDAGEPSRRPSRVENLSDMPVESYEPFDHVSEGYARTRVEQSVLRRASSESAQASPCTYSAGCRCPDCCPPRPDSYSSGSCGCGDPWCDLGSRCDCPCDDGCRCDACSERDLCWTPWCPGGYFFGEYLNWEPRRRGHDFAIRDFGSSSVVGGNILSLSLNRASGFRTGMGYRTESGWDLGLVYTYFHSNDSRGDTGGILRATMSHPAVNANAEVAEANAALEYDVLDLEAGRWLTLDDSLFVRLYGGVRGAILDQSFHIRYDGGDFDSGHVDAPVDFDGLGLRVGAEIHWDCGCGCSLFGRAAGSLLAGDFRLRRTETEDGRLLVSITEDYHQTVPVTELAVGGQVECCDWLFQAGYEFATWHDMAERLAFSDDTRVAHHSTTQGDLGFDGFFIRLSWIR
jgi:hypothetical protein